MKWLAFLLLLPCVVFAQVDSVTNFGKANISTLYGATDTLIVLDSLGSRFPISGYNLVWWNVEDYPDPSDDPNREIVRVESRSGDTLDVARGQDGTSASTKNVAGKTYRVILSATAYNFDQIRTSLNTKLAKADTASLSARINLKADTSAVLFWADTNVIATQSDISDFMVHGDTASLSSRIDAKLPSSDTTSIRNYSNSLYLKNADSTSIRNYSTALYWAKTDTGAGQLATQTDISDFMIHADTTSLSNRINLKADTSAVLFPYDTLGFVATNYDLTQIPLNQIINPTGAVAWNLGANGIVFTISTPSSPAIDINGTGIFTDDLLHIHQHTGNPGAGTGLLHLEAVDADVVPLTVNGANDTSAVFIGGKIFSDSSYTGVGIVGSLSGTVRAASGRLSATASDTVGLAAALDGKLPATQRAKFNAPGAAVFYDSLRFVNGTNIAITNSGNGLTVGVTGVVSTSTDSLGHKFVDSTGRTVTTLSKRTAVIYNSDSLKYKSLLVATLDTTGVAAAGTGVDNELYIDNALDINIRKRYQYWSATIDSSMIQASSTVGIAWLGANVQIDSVMCVGLGTTSFTWNVFYGTDRSSATDSLFDAIQTANSGTTGNLAAVNDGDLSYGQFMWVKFTAITTKPTQWAVTLKGRLR